MKLKYFVQCDEVRTEQGKYSAVGIFDTIFALIYPTQHKQFMILMGFEGGEGKHTVRLAFTDPSGSPLAQADGEFSVASHQHVQNVVFNFENFPLPAEGEYGVAVILDGNEVASYSFRVRPPMERRERTREEIESLLRTPDIIKSVNVEVKCGCGRAYKFQHNLDPNEPVAGGFLPLPPGDVFRCADCGAEQNLAQVRMNLDNLLGMPRGWLNAQQPAGGEGGHRPPPIPGPLGHA